MSSLKKQPSERRRLQRSATLAEARSADGSRVKPQKALSQSLVDLVTCAICLEQLKRPTMLPCQHTFCLQCLQGCVRGQLLRIACPTCRTEVQLPPQGVTGLPKNISLEAFLEVLRNDNGLQLAEKTPTAAEESCFRCQGKSAKVAVCKHCKKKFCGGCETLHLGEVTQQVNVLMNTLKYEHSRLVLLSEKLKVRCEKVEQNICLAAEVRMQKILEDQNRLLAEVKTWQENAERKSMELQEKCIEVRALIRRDDKAHLPKDGVLERAEAVLTDAKRYAETRLIFDDVDFKLLHENDEEAAASSADPEGPPASPAAVEEDVQPKKKVVQFAEQATAAEPTAAAAKDLKPKTGLPSTPDEHSLFYRCKSSSPKSRFSPTVLERPAGVAVSPWTGDIYVAATDSHCVYVLDKHGKIIKSLGSPYQSNSSSSSSNNSTGNCGPNGTFLCPFGIAFSTLTEQIYVTDKWLNCIQVFDKDGNYLQQLGSKGTSPGHFRSPEGIAIDTRGFIYVCDTCNDRVQVLDKSGAFVRELGVVSQVTLPNGKRYSKREFNEPAGVAVTPDGSRVAVCDYGNCRIRIFGPAGEKITDFGFRGTQRGQFQKPECVTMDNQGFVLVGDNGNSRIQIFRPNGNFVRMIGTKGNNPGQFSWISGIALTNELDIVVTDFKNHCIQFF